MSDPGLKFLYSRAPGDGSAKYEKDFFEALGIAPDRLVFVSQPTRLRSVLIPHQSFFLRHEAYSNHTQWAGIVAERMLKGERPIVSERPAYLSRTKFVPRPNTRETISNEHDLEDIFRNNNVDIYYPESMTLREQVRLVNTHRWVIGLRGSALHNAAFSLRGQDSHLCVIHEDHDHIGLTNYCLLDALSGINGHYIEGLHKSTSPASKNTTTISWDIDIDYVISWLSYKGVLPRSPSTNAALKRFQKSHPPATLLIHQAGHGDIASAESLHGGIPGCKLPIEGFRIDTLSMSPEEILYRARMLDGGWTNWVTAGNFVGSRGEARPLTGFAVKLAAPASESMTCSYRATFVGVPDPVVAANGEPASADTPLESMQILIKCN